MTRIRVAPAAEFGPGERRIVDTDEGEVGVFNVDGDLYAIKNDCPHRRGPVCTGKITGALVGDWSGIGERVSLEFDDEPAITCPWHGWDFYLSSGEHVGLESIAIPTYDVVVEDDTVFVDV